MEKILFITDVMSIGGVEKVLINTLNGLDYNQFDVTLLIMYKTEGEKDNLRNLNKRVKVKYLFEKTVKGKHQRILYQLFRFGPHLLINHFIVKEKYDILVTTKDVFSYPISSNKAYKVMWVHGGLEHLEGEDMTILTKMKRWYQKKTYGKFDKVLLLTNGTKNRFVKSYGIENKCRVLTNPINSNEIYELSNAKVIDYEFNPNLTKVVCTCRLSREKGVYRLVKSSIKLMREGFIFNLLIIGDGPEKNKLVEMVNNELPKDIKGTITFLGVKKNPYKYMSKCDIYVSPSITEGFSLSIAEAILLNLPIISTKCNGPMEILDHGRYGMLVENSEEGIYKGLKEMLTDRETLKKYKRKSMERLSFFSYSENIDAFVKYVRDKA
jgi:glycosyltransferase involved in cell wall biosynthesis